MSQTAMPAATCQDLANATNACANLATLLAHLRKLIGQDVTPLQISGHVNLARQFFLDALPVAFDLQGLLLKVTADEREAVLGNWASATWHNLIFDMAKEVPFVVPPADQALANFLKTDVADYPWAWDAIRANLQFLPEFEPQTVWAHLKRESALAKAEMEKEPAATPDARIPLRIDGRNVYFNGDLVPLDLTSDRADDAIAFLGELVKNPGAWVSSADIGRETKREGVRFDRLLKKLPPVIQKLVKSDPGKGYCVTWHK